MSSTKSILEKLKSLSAESSHNIVLNDKSPVSGTPTETSGVFVQIIRYGIIILILAFLGLNIFASLGLLTDNLVELFKPILVFLGYSVGETIKQTTDVTTEGTKAVVDATTSAISEGTTAVADTTQNAVNSAVNAIERRIDPDRAHTINALDDAERKLTTQINQKRLDSPQPDDSGSRSQLSKNSNKSGYCYIGEDRGFRSCIQVNEDDYCMSENIFPSKDICINPKLRV